MQKVVIAGSTGYLGKCAVKAFKEQGYYVRALARSPAKLEEQRPYIDDIFEAQATRPETLSGVCDGMDFVFSALGLTKQREQVTFMDVDYGGNKNLLDQALGAGVQKFVYTSVFTGDRPPDIEIFRVKEKFSQCLRDSGLDYAIIRPTGFFSDMLEVWKMARAGRVYLIGDGRHRGNPIDGPDLARVCADAVKGDQKEISVGGPEVLTHRQVAELAFAALGKPARITPIPEWVVRGIAGMARPFMKPRMRGAIEFLLTAMLCDFVAPAFEGKTLKEFFEELNTQAL